jgi:hypothetical protein
MELWTSGDKRLYSTEGVGYWHRGPGGDYEVFVPEQEASRHAKAILTCDENGCGYRGEFDEDALLAAMDQIAAGLPDGMPFCLDADGIMRWVRGSRG